MKWAVLIGLVLAVAPWVLFDIISAQNPHAILFGLGMIVIVVSFFGAVMTVVGLVGLIRAYRRPGG